MDLSIVTTLYYSELYLGEFYNRISASAEKITNNYEIILVNDGSPDSSLDIAVNLYNKDKRIKVIDLSRNFGHHKAIMTGLTYAKGDFVFLIDCDLEEEPEYLVEFYNKIKDSDADVIYGVQDKRKGGFLKKISGSIFYKIFNLLSTYPVPENLVIARIMTKRYVDELVKHKDHEIFLAGLWVITGFKQIPFTIKKHYKKKSTYNLDRKISVFINAVTSFSNKPLILIFYAGCIISLFSGILVSCLIIRRIFFGIYLTGWVSLIVSIWMLGGIIIFCLGLIGIYVSRIFMETKDRPYTVIRQIYGKTD